MHQRILIAVPKSKLQPNELHIGDLAPNFIINDVLGNSVTLSKYGNKSVLLVFLRYAGCPLCNLTVERLTLEYPMLKKQNCEVIAFIQSSPENILKNIYDRHDVKPQFPIISDPDMEIYKQYGVRKSRLAAIKSIRRVPEWLHSTRTCGYTQSTVDGSLFLVPAMFLIAKKSGKIVERSYGNSFYDFESLFPIYESLIFNEA